MEIALVADQIGTGESKGLAVDAFRTEFLSDLRRNDAVGELVRDRFL